MAFVSSSNNNTSSTNEAVNTAHGVFTASTQVNAANSTNIDNLSDVVIFPPPYTGKFFQKTGRKIIINGSDTAGYDKSKVECFNCHKMGHFARECKGPRNQDSINRNQDSSRRTLNVEETSSKSMVAIYGAGLFSPLKFDLSNSGQEEFQQPEFEGYRPKTSKSVTEDISNKIEFVRPKQQEKPVRKPVKLSEITIKGKGWPKAVNTARPKAVNTARPNSTVVNIVRANQGHPQKEDQGYVDSGCSRHMTGNMSFLSDFKEFDGGYVSFRGRAKGGKITRKGTLKTSKLDFEDVYFIKELQFNLFSVSHMCDKKNNVLFTKTGCFILSPNFKLADESQFLLKVPRKNNMYIVDMKNIVPKESLSCLVAKATLDESMLWHRMIGHVNFKTINKLVKENLVRGLPTKHFENNQTCVACLKGKQHKASCKTKIQNSITQPLFMLHMGLFGLTSMSSLMNKKYCLVVIDDYSRFTLVFFLATKDETSGILKRFITEIENLVDKKVKIIRCDNGTEFKNRVMSEFCEKKGIKKEFSIARTPQQNGVAERRNRTLIEAARTMLADSKLPTTFWAEAVNTACYVQNRVLVVKPHNKTPYELFRGRTPALSFMRPFGCHVTILNTLDYLGKFDGSTNSNDFAGTEESIGAGHSNKETGSSQDYILMPLWKDGSLFDSSPKNASNNEPQPFSDAGKKDDEGVNKESGIDDQEKPENSTQDVNFAGASINNASTDVNTSSLNINIVSPTVTIALLEATHADFFGDETKIDISNITTTYLVLSTLNTRIHKDHSLDHVIGDVQSGVQTRRMTKTTNEQGFISAVYEGKTHEDLHTCLFAYFLSQEEPKKVWTLVDLPHRKRAIGTKWVYMKKKDERVARTKAIRLFLAYASFKDFVVYQMDVNSAFLYGKIEEEVYVCQPPGFEDLEFPDRVYKVEKALYGLHQAPRACLIYVDDIIFGSTKKELCTKFKKLMHKKFQMSFMGELAFFLGLQVTQKDDGIFISQDKYVDEILKKFGFSTVKTSSTPMETSKPLINDENAKSVDVHLYRSMIGSLMYLTSLRPDIMFVVCACARFQVTHKVSHLYAVKRIFRYLKGQPKLGIWYPKDSPFDLEAYTDSDYAGASLDGKSITGGCQFLGSRLISWQCKKQTVVANSITEAEYVAAPSCCRQLLWIQNKMLDYGYNFMNTKIFIDNESTICIVKNPVFHSKTKHIKIRHHFIRDSNEKKLIQMIKIHTNQNVADLHTKAFDFWETATTRTLDNGEIKLTATIDGKGLVVQGEGSTYTHQCSINLTTTSVDVRYGGATATVTGLEAGQGSGNIDKTPTMLHDSPFPRKVESLETDLKQTKQIYGVAYTRLIKKVKNLEKIVKSSQARRRAKIVVYGEEDDLEDPSKYGRNIDEINQDPGISLVQHDAEIQGRYGHDMDFDFDFDAAKKVSTAKKDISTAEPVLTVGAAVTTAGMLFGTKIRLKLGLAVRVKDRQLPLCNKHNTHQSAPSNLQPPILPTSKRTNTHESVVPQPRSPTQSLVVDEAASTGVDVRYGGATTLLLA
ncbi:putative ribonuclease H-like domain-containing protein [Tanacetum coccineum]